MEIPFIVKIGLGILALGFLAYYFLKSGGASSEFIHHIDSASLKEVIKTNSKIQLVDVRTTGEVKKGMIKPAVHIDIHSSDFANQFGDFEKDQPIYLYCRSGMRSMKACNILAKNGFTDLYNLKGGYIGY